VLDNTNKIKYLSQPTEPVKMVDRERVGSELILGLKSLKWFLGKSAGLEQESAGQEKEVTKKETNT
jgi:hypothetical protein